MRNAILAAFIVFVAAVLVTGAQGSPTPQCTCPDGYVAQCVAMTPVPPTVTPAPTSGGGEMASEGPNSPDTVVDGGGSFVWSDPGNAVSSNNSYAVQSTQYYPYESNALQATDFDFAIPAGSTIDGIVVEIERKADIDSEYGFIVDLVVYAMKGGDIQFAENKADGANHWPLSDTVKSYGGAADLWSNTWTVADINGSGFGAAIAIYSSGEYGDASAYVDHIRITVYYTEGGGGATRSQYRAMLGAGW